MIVDSERFFREQKENSFIMYVPFVIMVSEYLWMPTLKIPDNHPLGDIRYHHDPCTGSILSGIEDIPTQLPTPPQCLLPTNRTAPALSATCMSSGCQPWAPGNKV